VDFFFFFDMSTQERGEGIRTNDIYFMRRGLQPIELLLGDELVDIQSKLSDVPPGEVDKPIWTISRKGVYVSAETWEFMRKRK